MIIQSIELNNIQCHRQLKIDLSQLTVITGPNDSGKTTIANSLEALLTGKVTHAHGTGNASIKDLLTKGESTGAITAKLKDGRRITRTTDGSMSLSWKPRAGARDLQHELERAMGCTQEKARLALSGQRFFRLEQKEQKALLQEMLCLDVSPQVIENKLLERAKETGLDLLDELLRTCGAGVCVNDFGRIYDRLYKERTGTKKLLAEYSSQVATLEKSVSEQVFVSDEDHKKAIETERIARVNRDQVVSQLSGRKEAERQVEVTKIKLAARAAEQAGESNDDPKDLQKRIDDCRERLQSLRRDLDNARALDSRLTDLGNRRQLTFKTLQAAEGWAAPASSCCHKCGAPNEWAEREAGANEQKKVECRAELQRLDQQIQAIELEKSKSQEPNVLTQRVQAGEQRVRELHGKLRLAEQAGLNRKLLDDAQKAHSEAQERLSSFGDPIALSEKLATLDEAISRAKATCSQADAYHAARGELDRSRNKMHLHANEVKCLEVLVPFYAPDGFQLDYTALAMHGFESMLNQYLAPMGLAGRYLQDLTFEVSRDGGPWVPYTRAADSGFLLVGLAHQLAFAEYTGLGIVILDRLEALYPDRRLELIEACQAVQGVDHILLMGALEGPVTGAEGVNWVSLAREAVTANV